MKVALFGGSFNPIHNGHLQIAKELLDKKVVDEVWFIPCGNHPFNKVLANGKDRIKMIKLAIGRNSRIKVLDLEVISKNISFTSETIKLLRNNFKKVEFYFIIGADNLKNLQKWHNFEYLKNNVEFLLVTRKESELTNTLGIKIFYTLKLENNISSTQVRYLLKSSKSLEGLIPKKVEQYIKKEALF